MLKYIARRLLMLIPVLLGVTLLVFSLMYITPGDPVDSLLGDNATPEAREALREELGLNGGYFERFFNYVVRLLRGDMGICYSTRQNVATRIAQTFPNTVKLASFAVVFAVVFGLTFGIVSAIRQYSIIDNIVMSISMIGISMPSFWCGLLLMLLFSVAAAFVHVPFGAAVLVGYLSHLLLDLLNKRGIQLFFPFEARFCLRLCYAGKTANKVFTIIGAIATLALMIFRVVSVLIGM